MMALVKEKPSYFHYCIIIIIIIYESFYAIALLHLSIPYQLRRQVFVSGFFLYEAEQNFWRIDTICSLQYAHIFFISS